MTPIKQTDLDLLARVQALEAMVAPMYEQYKREKSKSIRKNSIHEVEK